MRYKSKRIRNEYWDHTDKHLRVVLEKLDEYCDQQFNKHVMLTCLVRTPEENEQDKGKPASKHMLNQYGKCCAADIRVVNKNHPDPKAWLTRHEGELLAKYFREEFMEIRGDYVEVEDDHVHVQVAIRDRERNDKPFYIIGTVDV